MADDRHSDCVNEGIYMCVSDNYVGEDLILPTIEGVSVDNPAQANIKNQYM